MSIIVSPSILSSDFANLQSTIELLNKSNANMVHIDVMDGVFVPNITIGACVIKNIKKHSKLPFDVHLMIENPSKHVESFVKAGADILTVHFESETHIDSLVKYIKSFGVKVGIALNPATSEENLRYLLDDIDLVLVMTVNPGFGGQKFIHSQLKKIENIRKMIDESGRDITLEIDGGIDENTAKLTIKSGANALVAGNYIFQDTTESDILKKIYNLKFSS